MLLKHTSKPLDPPLISLFCIAEPVIIFFVCKNLNLAPPAYNHVPEVMEIKICSFNYIVSEGCESYPLKFILILFEDSGFLIDVNYSLLLSSYRLVQKQIEQ